MASVRRVQPLLEMGILCLFLCVACVQQVVTSDPFDGNNGKSFNAGSHNRPLGDRLPDTAQGKSFIDRQPPQPGAGANPGAGIEKAPVFGAGVKKVDPNFSHDEMNRPRPLNQFGRPIENKFGRNEPHLPPADKKYNLGYGANAPKSSAFGHGHGVGLGRKLPQIKISEHEACKEDARQLCSSSSLSNNFAVLDCLQSDFKKDVTEKCQHFLWEYKKNLTTDIRFDAAASEVCKDALAELTECNVLDQGTGHRISCLIAHKPNITSVSCKQFLTKMASIVFSDYRLIYKFADSCQNDIRQNNCGRIEKEDGNNAPHSQGQTIACLSEHLNSLDQQCKREIVRIAELQADDYHMDRPLFYACREDRERFCQRTKAGGGKVYKCLYRHKFERDMSTACREKLVVRQSLTRENFRVNKAFSDACRSDIRKYKCSSGEKPEFRQAKLSMILLCLEGEQRDGHPVTPECIGELKEVRRSLMEDYKISPSIVVDCASEIKDSCNGGLHREGRTLHCLMDLARDRNKKNRDPIGDKCRRSLEQLLREADAGEDYSMDPALQKACQPVVDTACKHISAGDARVMSCLMEKVGSTSMNDECEERLMEIQYFIARDFKLDARLYKFCHKDAVKYCHADTEWAHERGPSNHPIIFSCLYRQQKLYSSHPDLQLNRACAFEVKRIMRQRSISVELEPRIEEPCLADLGQLCSQRTNKGEEIECLRQNFDKLDKKCQMAVSNFTEDVEKDPTIDRILMKACTPMIKTFCSDLIDKDDVEPTEIMECLIKHKHSAGIDRKCAAGIEHHQLISLQDYKFSFKFKEACKADVIRNCQNARKKSAVIVCLSEIHRNDTLLERTERLSRSCRKQLRFELFQRSESIDLDPALQKACYRDRKEFCDNITPGNAMVIECLKKHQSNLSASCRAKLFKREMNEAIDNSVDFVLMTTCKSMIKQYCPDNQVSEVYLCLLNHKSRMDFDPKCKRVVKERQLIHNKDYRLNPELRKSCKLDIPKFCKNIIPSGDDANHMLEGRVINCLKIQFVARRLSRDCEDHIRGFIKEAALNYKDDPVLAHQCKYEIAKFCLDTGTESDDDDGKGHVEECLKKKLAENRITSTACRTEVIRIISESHADIQVDPLLHRACALDVKHYCHGIAQGEGRQMSCLLNALEDKTVRLQTDCRKMLQDRVAMWEYAAKVAPPESLGDLMTQVQASKSRNYFLGIILGILCVIFFGGLFCGRVSKRVRAEVKNK